MRQSRNKVRSDSLKSLHISPRSVDVMILCVQAVDPTHLVAFQPNVDYYDYDDDYY